MPKQPTIDVVVPIHNAGEELEACLASVHRHGGNYRLVLIDDASTDERVRALFRRLSAQRWPGCVLLHNEHRAGRVNTVNRGMALSANDVVLLDAATLVTAGWLDKMRRCAASDSRIGTVTPFAHQAGIGSSPESLRNNPVAEDPERINRALELAVVPLYPEIPSASGSCMFIRRTLIREIGAFDPDVGDDHGDAVDFSMRARKAGYRNVLCDDACVVYPGSRSVAEPGDTSAGHDLAKVLARHADYLPLVRAFNAQDPLRPVRGMIRSQRAVLGGENRPGVLHVVHARGGGTEKYIAELIAASRGGYRHYFLRILPDRWLLMEADAAQPSYYAWSRDGDGANGDWLRPVCAWLRIGVVHVHSLVGTGDDFLQVLGKSAVPYCYSVHDMYLPCPTVYLINSEGQYCNATTDHALCRQCLSKCSGLDTDVDRWRARYGAFLRKASRIFAPSRWAADTLTKYYPGIAVTVAPHRHAQCPDSSRSTPVRVVHNVFPLPDDECRHIGVLGAIGPEKGARHLDALVARIRERRLPLRMVVVGYTDFEARQQSSDQVLTIHGRYRPEDIEALLDSYRIALVVFPTVWPETFSYTLSEGWMAGRPALVPPRGALQERVLATGAGWIMEGWPDADAVLDQLVALTAPENRTELERAAQRAKAVFREGLRAAEPAADVYRDVLAKAAGQAAPDISIARYPIYEAACHALGMDPMPQAAARSPAGPVQRRTTIERLVGLLRG